MRSVRLWGIVLFLAASRSFGAEPLALTLEDAVRRAAEQSIDLQSRSLDLGAAAYAADHLWAEIFPGISANGGLNYRTGLFSGTGINTEPESLSYSASLELRLSMNAGLPKTMRLLQLAYRSQLLSYENLRRQLEIQVSRTFFSLITGRERLAHLERISDLAERQREKSRIAFENGLAGELSYLRSRLGAENARLNLNKERVSYGTQTQAFLALLGLGEEAGEVRLEGGLNISPVEADAEGLIAEYLVKRPDILAQRQTIERLEYERARDLLTAYGPTLSLNFTTQRTGNFGKNLAGTFSDNLSGGLALSIPVDSFIPGTKTAQRFRAADTGIEKARLELKNLENRARNDIRSYAANLRNSWSTVEISRLQVQIAERTYELTEQGFQQGAVEYLTLEDTRNSMSEARQQLLTNELAYQNTILDLAAALNMDWRELMRSMP